MLKRKNIFFLKSLILFLFKINLIFTKFLKIIYKSFNQNSKISISKKKKKKKIIKKMSLCKLSLREKIKRVPLLDISKNNLVYKR